MANNIHVNISPTEGDTINEKVVEYVKANLNDGIRSEILKCEPDKQILFIASTRYFDKIKEIPKLQSGIIMDLTDEGTRYDDHILYISVDEKWKSIGKYETREMEIQELQEEIKFLKSIIGEEKYQEAIKEREEKSQKILKEYQSNNDSVEGVYDKLFGVDKQT